MTVRILIDSTPFEWRVARLEGETVTRIDAVYPGRADLTRGAVVDARVTAHDARLGGAFAVVGDVPAFVRSRGRLPPVGAVFTAEVRRAAFGVKAAELSPEAVLRLPVVAYAPGGAAMPGPVEVSAEVCADMAARAERARLTGALPSILLPLTRLMQGGVDRIDVSDIEIGRSIAPWLAGACAIGPQPAGAIHARLDQAFAEALRARLDLPRGGRIHIDETEALTAIDLDLGAQGGQSAKGAGQKLLDDALLALGAHAPLAHLGGQLVIDVPRAAIPAPAIIRDRLTRTFRGLGQVSVPAIAPGGLCVVVAPRHGPSLLERMTEAASGAVRPGRRLRADILAAAAWRAAHAEPGGRGGAYTLRLAPRIAPLFTPAIIDALAKSTGAAFTLRTDADEAEPFHVSRA